MTLRARGIAGARQTHRSSMFNVAVRTHRRRSLFSVMIGAIVAPQARLIRGDALEPSRHMARAALLRKHRVRVPYRTGIIWFWITRKPVPAQPRQTRRREADRQNAA